MSNRIYLDNNATTPCDPRVLNKMLPFFLEQYGNPANGFHLQGRSAAKAVDLARVQVANLIGAQSGEMIFTSGATESNNLAIMGLARRNRFPNRKRIVITAIEHKAVIEPSHKLAEKGFDLIVLPVDSQGVVSLDDALACIDENTLLVSVQVANNETGVIQPIKELADMAHAVGAYIHSDAAQAVGKISVNVMELGVDMLSISAHKLYGPKGIGALYIRGGVRSISLEPLTFGGGQEFGLRPGTSNVPGIVGLGEACSIAQAELHEDQQRIEALRDEFEIFLKETIPGLQINSGLVPRLPNTSNLTLPDVEADAILLNLPEVMMGTGSACTSGAIEPSHVLQAIGLDREQAHSSIRASLGRFTTSAEIDVAKRLIAEKWRGLRHQ